MGFFRKEKNYENTKVSKQGTRGSFNSVKRYVKKLLAFATATFVFGVVYSGGTTQAILDLAWRGNIGWMTALEQSFIKALQYGTVKSPELLNEMITMFMNNRPITGLVNYFIPLAMLFVAYFYLVSFIVDLLDGREGEVYRYWFIALITVIVMAVIFAMMTGYNGLTQGADVTFNKSEIVQNVNQTGSVDPINESIGENVSVNSTIDGSELNESSSNSWIGFVVGAVS
mgnify:CR=1 FL=1